MRETFSEFGSSPDPDPLDLSAFMFASSLLVCSLLDVGAGGATMFLKNSVLQKTRVARITYSSSWNWVFTTEPLCASSTLESIARMKFTSWRVAERAIVALIDWWSRCYQRQKKTLSLVRLASNTHRKNNKLRKSTNGRCKIHNSTALLFKQNFESHTKITIGWKHTFSTFLLNKKFLNSVSSLVSNLASDYNNCTKHVQSY